MPNVKSEDLVVHMSQGSKSGSNGNYIARVTSIGELTITLSKRDGTKLPESFTVKIKRLPDPTDPDFPPELRKNLKLKYDSSSISQLKQKILQQNQAEIRQVYAEKQLQANVTDDLKLTWEPIIYLGVSPNGRIQIDYLRAQKEIRLTPGYTLVTATIYFQGPGFESNVVAVTLNSKSLAAAETSINRCKDGAQIVFDNVKVKDKNGNIQTLTSPPMYIVGFNNMENKVQEKELQAQKNNMVFTQVEENPQFTGGDEAWKKYLRENLKANTPVDERWKAGKYTITLKFIVHTDGTVSDITTDNYKGSKTAQHCIDVIKNAPKWQPAVQNGRKVNAYKKQPVTFVIEE